MGTTFSCALFDVDGTVVDSAPAVVGVFEQTLRSFDLPVPLRERLRAYVGPPLRYSFGDLGYAPPLLERLVATYRDLYSHCFLEPRPFDGIEGLFAALRSAGVALATATSKQAPMALAQFEHLGFMEYFDVVAGATPDPESTKTTVIHEALERLAGLGADVSRPVMVGDSVWDVRGAHEAGLPVIGSAVGMNRDIVIPGENGFLATSTDTWAESLETLIASPELRVRLGHRGREDAENRYSIAAVGPRLVQLLREAAQP